MLPKYKNQPLALDNGVERQLSFHDILKEPEQPAQKYSTEKRHRQAVIT